MASASKNNHDAGKKKMSLEEFFSDNSLGDSVWDEQEIDLNAIKTSISNTTSLDVLKNSAPPYILKFANLPASFSNYEIEDLFKAKRAQFVKFKLFWELNKTLGAKNEPTVFQQLFKRDSKVAFVEVYSYRDMEKILTQWKTPLRELYNIRVDMPSFDDFKEYMDKDKLIDPRDDASKPYRAPEGGAAAARRRSSGEGLPPPTERRKSNPFGSAKPVDTQTKLLQIESKIDQLGIEDTKTLRRLTIGSDEEDNHENESNQEKGDRVRKSLQVLKREKNIDDNDSEAISNHAASMSPPPSASNATTATASASATPPPKLNFMSIIKKKEQTELQDQKIKEEEAIKENAAREEESKRHAQARIDEEARRQAEDENSGDYSSGANGDDNGNGNRGSDSHGNHHHSNQNYSNNFKFKDSGNNDYNNNNRRGGGDRGGRGGRGDRGGRGRGRGGYSD
ncbi:polymerase suppressor [Kluyveromyces marxianus]|nr:polymerase suppressor [Kluyveromyces marxianus]